MKRTSETYEWYSLAAQIISGEQKELEEVMLDQMSDWTGKNIDTVYDLKVSEIINWLIDCQEAIGHAGLIK